MNDNWDGHQNGDEDGLGTVRGCVLAIAIILVLGAFGAACFGIVLFQ